LERRAEARSGKEAALNGIESVKIGAKIEDETTS